MNRPNIVVLGSANVDISARTALFPRDGETVTGEQVLVGTGGKGTNQATAASRAGASVTMIAKLGCDFFADSPTNQQFPIFPNTALKKLGEKYTYSTWALVSDTHTAIRFATSWATKDENVEALCADIAAVMAEI